MQVLAISRYDDALHSVRAEAAWLIGLHRAGCRVDVMGQGEHLDLFREAGMRVIAFHPQGKVSREAVRRIRAELDSGGHDILFTFNSKAVANGNFAARGWPGKVVTYRGAAGLYWHDPFAYLTHLHPRVDRILCVSEYIRDRVRRALPGRPDKAVTVYKGHDLAWYTGIQPADRGRLGVPDDAVMACCVANLRPVKGVKYLVRAMDHLPPGLPLWLVLIGRDTDGPSLGRTIRRVSGAERILTLGYRDSVLPLVASCDLYIQPSLSEGLPKTVLEAMGLGRPVVASQGSAFPEVVRQGETGLMVPRRDPEALARAMATLARDPGRRRTMGAAGRERLGKVFTTGETVRRTLRVFEDLLSQD